MNIAIVGYGRMGREIETQVLENNHTIACKIDPMADDADYTDLEKAPLSDLHIDVAIEFSTAQSVVSNAKCYCTHRVSAVLGTTGWQQQNDELRDLVNSSEIAYVHGSNFSLGAHIFMRTAEFLTKLVNNVPEYDLGIHEIHHTKKVDRPSGTALSTAKRILPCIERKEAIITDIPHRTAITPSDLAVTSQRVGQEPGYHELVSDSTFDTVLLSHRARTRAGFALGALRCAEWIAQSKVKGFLSVDSFIDAYLAKHS